MNKEEIEESRQKLALLKKPPSKYIKKKDSSSESSSSSSESSSSSSSSEESRSRRKYKRRRNSSRRGRRNRRKHRRGNSSRSRRRRGSKRKQCKRSILPMPPTDEEMVAVTSSGAASSSASASVVQEETEVEAEIKRVIQHKGDVKKVLKMPEDAKLWTKSTIDSHYKKIIRAIHPDKCRGERDEIQRLSTIATTILQEAQRAMYNMAGCGETNPAKNDDSREAENEVEKCFETISKEVIKEIRYKSGSINLCQILLKTYFVDNKICANNIRMACARQTQRRWEIEIFEGVEVLVENKEWKEKKEEAAQWRISTRQQQKWNNHHEEQAEKETQTHHRMAEDEDEVHTGIIKVLKGKFGFIKTTGGDLYFSTYNLLDAKVGSIVTFNIRWFFTGDKERMAINVKVLQS